MLSLLFRLPISSKSPPRTSCKPLCRKTNVAVFCSILLLSTSHADHSNVIKTKLNGHSNNWRTDGQPELPRVAGKSNSHINDHKNSYVDGNYKYMGNSVPAGAGLNTRLAERGVGIGVNYDSANKGVNVGANVNFRRGFNGRVGYNSANKGVDASIGINFRRGPPPMQRYADPEAVVARAFLEEDLRFLQKTVGSRHSELLKVNLSEKFDPETYSANHLIEDLSSMQKQLGESIPQICTFISMLAFKQPCRPPLPAGTAGVDQLNKELMPTVYVVSQRLDGLEDICCNAGIWGEDIETSKRNWNIESLQTVRRVGSERHARNSAEIFPVVKLIGACSESRRRLFAVRAI